MYYPTVSAGLWPNAYQIGTPQQQAIPTVYYQVPTNTMPEMMVQQSVPTVYYSAPTMTGPPISTATTSEGIVQQTQGNTTTTTKTITTRILDPTTQTIATSTAAASVAPVTTTTTTVVPPVDTTTIQEIPRHQTRGLRSLSTLTSASSDETTTSTDSTVTPEPEPIKTNTILPPVIPIQTTTTVAPVHRVIHRPYTPSGYYSSDLDYGKRKIYKTDYKYRHYYCCNVCKGRFDLHNRSYSCCEWFYGCPVWSLILCGLFFLALLVTFFTLLGLQPSLNSSRFASTAETRLLNRTQIVYGFYKNCGYQINATSGTPTTLILCTNTATTTTAQIQLSPFYTVISEATDYSSCRILILFCSLSILQISKS